VVESEEAVEWKGEAMAAEEKDTNGLIKADHTMKEEKTREKERSTALLIDR
jgi:hypothetical protein